MTKTQAERIKDLASRVFPSDKNTHGEVVDLLNSHNRFVEGFLSTWFLALSLLLVKDLLIGGVAGLVAFYFLGLSETSAVIIFAALIIRGIINPLIDVSTGELSTISNSLKVLTICMWSRDQHEMSECERELKAEVFRDMWEQEQARKTNRKLSERNE